MGEWQQQAVRQVAAGWQAAKHDRKCWPSRHKTLPNTQPLITLQLTLSPSHTHLNTASSRRLEASLAVREATGAKAVCSDEAPDEAVGDSAGTSSSMDSMATTPSSASGRGQREGSTYMAVVAWKAGGVVGVRSWQAGVGGQADASMHAAAASVAAPIDRQGRAAAPKTAHSTSQQAGKRAAGGAPSDSSPSSSHSAMSSSLSLQSSTCNRNKAQAE